MINFSDFFNKKFLITLFGLFFISLVTLDPFFHDHDAFEDEHSELECHFCLIEIYDRSQPWLKTKEVIDEKVIKRE